MTFTVVYDACVLYPNTLRDLLIRIAQSGTVQARWTEKILDEMSTALRRNRPDIPDSKLERLRVLMNDAVRDCLVSDYEPLIDGLKLPDPDDRHVLAAAIKSGAQIIVTQNLRDFPIADLEQWDIEAKSADEFIHDQIGISGHIVAACVQQIADSRIRPPAAFDDVLSQLERDGLLQSVTALRALPVYATTGSTLTMSTVISSSAPIDDPPQVVAPTSPARVARARAGARRPPYSQIVRS